MELLKVGEEVTHQELGLGKIIKIDTKHIFVDFSKAPEYFISLEQAPQHLNRYRFLDNDDIVRHDTYGIGLVISTESLHVNINFTRAGEKKLEWLIAERRCTKLRAGGLGAYLYEHRKAAFDQLKKDPKELVRLALLDLDREAKTDDIKRELVLYGFIKESEWGTWWKTVTALLREDPIFDVSESRRQVYRLREKPKAIEEQMIERFLSLETFEDRFRIAKQIQDRFGKNLTLAQIEVISQPFLTVMQDSAADLTERMQAYLLLKKLGTDINYEPHQLIKPGLDISEIVHSGDADDVMALVGRNEGWAEILATGLRSKAPKVREYCLESLVEAKRWELLRIGFETLMAGLPKNGDIFLWLLAIDLEKDFPLGFQPQMLMEKVFTLFEDQRYRQKAIELLSDQGRLTQIISISTDAVLRDFFEFYFKNSDITVFTKELILSLLEELQRDDLLTYFSGVVGKQMKKVEMIELTQKEYDIMEQKFNHHLDEELVDVTRKMAATRGSDEYEKYLNRQQLLLNRIKQLKQTLKNCRVTDNT